MLLLAECALVLITLILMFLLYMKWTHTYWARQNVPYTESTSIFGHLDNPINPKVGGMIHTKRAYDELKRRGHIHGGIYFLTDPIYVPVNIDLIKNIFTKDFQNFRSHGFEFNEDRDPLAAHLFNLEGERWRNMRIKLTPTFTSGKMKMMFKTLLDCGIPMIDHIDKLYENGEALDIKDIVACYTTDIIDSCAFGLECNSFKDPNAEFRSYGRKIFKPTFSVIIQSLIGFCAPILLKLLPLKLLPKDIESFFINAVKDILEYRTTNGIKRNDFIQLFLEIQEKAKADGVEPLTLKEITAQVFVFFIAGFETSATTMTFCLHELAFNQDIQDKLREEVRETLKKHDGVLTYDAIMEMEYMDRVVNETLRKYPPLPIITRLCSLDYKVPNTEVTIKKGTKVFISALGLHRDEQYYPDPDKFDPDRFIDENKAKRNPFTFIPFGEGPRVCIGLRFGLMQTKTGLSMLLNNYKLSPGDNESYNIHFDPMSFILAKNGPVMLNVEKLSS